MSEGLFYPADYYQSFPHLRLTKKKYLILDKDRLCLVKIKRNQSKVTFIEYLSQIGKMEVRMVQTRYTRYLAAFFVPTVGKRKIYPVMALEGYRYRRSDWIRVIEFFEVSGFKPHLYPDREKASKTSKPIGMDARVWYSPYDKIFQLYEDPVFFKEYTKLKLSTWAGVFTLIGSIFLVCSLVYLIVMFDLFPLWISCLSVSAFLLLLGLPNVIKYAKARKELVRKYGLEYHFK